MSRSKKGAGMNLQTFQKISTQQLAEKVISEFSNEELIEAMSLDPLVYSQFQEKPTGAGGEDDTPVSRSSRSASSQKTPSSVKNFLKKFKKTKCMKGTKDRYSIKMLEDHLTKAGYKSFVNQYRTFPEAARRCNLCSKLSELKAVMEGRTPSPVELKTCPTDQSPLLYIPGRGVVKGYGPPPSTKKKASSPKKASPAKKESPKTDSSAVRRRRAAEVDKKKKKAAKVLAERKEAAARKKKSPPKKKPTTKETAKSKAMKKLARARMAIQMGIEEYFETDPVVDEVTPRKVKNFLAERNIDLEDHKEFFRMELQKQFEEYTSDSSPSKSSSLPQFDFEKKKAAAPKKKSPSKSSSPSSSSSSKKSTPPPPPKKKGGKSPASPSKIAAALKEIRKAGGIDKVTGTKLTDMARSVKAVHSGKTVAEKRKNIMAIVSK